MFETEREARRVAELLEQNAARVAAAVTIDDVADAIVADLAAAGFGLASVQLLGPRGLEVLAVGGAPPGVDALRSRRRSTPTP